MRLDVLSLVILALLAGRMFAQANPTPAPREETSSPRNQSLRNVYREGFQPPADADAEAKRMRELIEKINRTTLPKALPVQEPPKPTPAEVIVPNPQPKPQPVAPVEPPVILSDKTLKQLRERMPDSVADPIRLGDALFHGGHTTEALHIYRKALEDGPAPNHRGWLLYQIGCCLLETKPAEAKTYFLQVRKELPNTQWSQLAEIQLELVEWIERNQPIQFLEDLRRDLQDKGIESPKTSQPRTGGQTKKTGSGTLGPQTRAQGK